MQILDAVGRFGVEVGTEDDKPTKHGKEGGSGKSKGVPVAVELYVNEFTGVRQGVTAFEWAFWRGSNIAGVAGQFGF